jgi:TonB-linked SusC/RagA family outer membrane protein
VSYNAYYSFKKIAKTLDVLNASDYVKWQYELDLLRNNGKLSKNFTSYYGNYQDIDLYDNVESNDWQDLTFGRTGHTFNHNLNINGGSDKVKYAFGYAYMDDKAIMEGSSYKRNNVSLKLNTKPAKNVNVDFSVRFSETAVRGGGANDASSTLNTDKRLKYSVIYTPIPLENLDPDAGTDDDLGNLYNPLTTISDNDRKQTRQTLNMAGSFQWEFVKNLKFKTEVGYDNYTNKDKRFWGLTTYYIKNTPEGSDQGHPAIQLANTSRYRMRSTNTLNYDFKGLIKNKDHNLTALIGHEWVITKQDVLTNVIHGFPTTVTADEAWRLTGLGSTNFKSIDYYSPDDKLLSYFARVNYDFQGKYLLSATFRADGSSKFASGNQWGYFPSAAIAWRISSEKFMEKTKSWLDDLKLRFSLGTAGNNNIPSGQIVQQYEASNTTWINGFNTVWAPSTTMANPDLKWETTITRNIGLDYTILGGKINGSIEGYINTTKDLLIEFPVSGTGYDTQYRNMGKTQNSGVEFTINYDIVNKKKWGLSLSANIGYNKNEIKSLGVMDDFGTASYWASTQVGMDYWTAVGGSVGQMRGYRYDGRYEVDDFVGYDAEKKKWILKDGVADASSVVCSNLRPGSMKLKDLNGDGIVDANDVEIIGDANPVVTGGFSLNARAYGFDLAANFNYSIGNDIYNANKIEFSTTGNVQYRNLLASMGEGKRWTNLNADGTLCNDPETLKALNANTTEFSPWTDRMIFSDWAVEDGSFLRLSTLTLGYTLPKTITKKAHIESLRFYATCYNVFCLTGYSGYDPEVSTMRKTALTPGVDYSAYPKSRQYVIGFNLNF